MQKEQPKGSNTLTITENPPINPQNEVVVTLKKKKKSVKWDASAVDNEGMGKKSSKSM